MEGGLPTSAPCLVFHEVFQGIRTTAIPPATPLCGLQRLCLRHVRELFALEVHGELQILRGQHGELLGRKEAVQGREKAPSLRGERRGEGKHSSRAQVTPPRDLMEQILSQPTPMPTPSPSARAHGFSVVWRGTVWQRAVSQTAHWSSGYVRLVPKRPLRSRLQYSKSGEVSE